jgi:hypothetical protein
LSTKVEFGFAKQGEGGIPQFNDISADVVSVSVNRGKDPQQDTFNAATCSIQLRNNDRNYDPDYGPSPYQGQIVPTGQVKVYKDDQIIFTGLITDWNFSYSPTGESLAEIVAADAFWNLNNQTLTGYEPVEQLTSARILSVLARPEVGGTVVWPTSSKVLSVGVATVGDYEVTDGTNVLSYLQEVEKAEPGRLFIDKEGRIVFRSRNNDLLNPDYEYTRINLSANPSFENNLDSWFYTIGGLTRSTAQSYIGTASGLVAAGGGAEQYFTSEVGQTYTVSLYAKASAGTVTVDFAGLTSTNGTAYSEVNKVAGTVTSTDWTRVSTTFDAVSVYSGLRVIQTPSSASVYIDAILAEATPVLDAYFDGANAPVYNTTDPTAPDYQPARAFETYDPEWVLG